MRLTNLWGVYSIHPPKLWIFYCSDTYWSVCEDGQIIIVNSSRSLICISTQIVLQDKVERKCNNQQISILSFFILARSWVCLLNSQSEFIQVSSSSLLSIRSKTLYTLNQRKSLLEPTIEPMAYMIYIYIWIWLSIMQVMQVFCDNKACQDRLNKGAKYTPT